MTKPRLEVIVPRPLKTEMVISTLGRLAVCDDSEAARILPTIPCSWIDGVPNPHFLDEASIRQVFSEMPFRGGDVILVTTFPAGGLCRMLRAVLQDGSDMWSPELGGCENWLEGGASLYGPERYIQAIERSEGRRLFETKVFPSLFPVQRLVEAAADTCPAPKVVVLLADPRFAVTVLRETMVLKLGVAPPLQTLLEVDLQGRFRMWGDYLRYGLEWGEVAAQYPEQVRLFAADRFSSWDPVEVRSALLELADFLEVPKAVPIVDRAMSSSFCPPSAEVRANLAKDFFPPASAVQGGPLVELLGPRLQAFEDTMTEMRLEIRSMWNGSLLRWRDAANPLLVWLGSQAAGAMASLPPTNRLLPMRGEEAHKTGTCRPCLFAMRGTCRNSAEMCAFCHEDGHAAPKRASQKKRMALQRRRVRTPSPDR